MVYTSSKSIEFHFAIFTQALCLSTVWSFQLTGCYFNFRVFAFFDFRLATDRNLLYVTTETLRLYRSGKAKCEIFKELIGKINRLFEKILHLALPTRYILYGRCINLLQKLECTKIDHKNELSKHSKTSVKSSNRKITLSKQTNTMRY